MKRLLNATLCLGLLVAAAGCSICQGPDDYGYPAYGGRWQRTNRDYGRVGSRFTPEVGSQVTVSGETNESTTEADLYPDYAPEPSFLPQ